MDKQRILILDSINDSITRRRTALMNIVFRELSVEHEYLVNIKKEDVEQTHIDELEYWFSQRCPFSHEECLEALENKIKQFNPNYILLHTGIVFRHYPKDVLQLLKDIKIIYPKIKIGYQYHPLCKDLDDVVFDRDEITKKIEDLIFAR